MNWPLWMMKNIAQNVYVLRVKGSKPDVIFTLDEKVASQTSDEMSACPRDHKFVLTGIDGQSLSVIGREPRMCVCILFSSPTHWLCKTLCYFVESCTCTFFLFKISFGSRIFYYFILFCLDTSSTGDPLPGTLFSSCGL